MKINENISEIQRPPFILAHPIVSFIYFIFTLNILKNTKYKRLIKQIVNRMDDISAFDQSNLHKVIFVC